MFFLLKIFIKISQFFQNPLLICYKPIICPYFVNLTSVIFFLQITKQNLLGFQNQNNFMSWPSTDYLSTDFLLKPLILPLLLQYLKLYDSQHYSILTSFLAFEFLTKFFSLLAFFFSVLSYKE